MSRKRRTESDNILVALDVDDSSRKVEMRSVSSMVMESEIRVHDGCFNRVADMEATIRSDVVPLYVSSPWSPQSPRALPELYQLLFGKEEATAIILIPLTIVQSLCRISWTVPIDILYLIAVHRRDSRIVPKSVVLNLVKPQNKNRSSIDEPHSVLAE